MKTKFIAVIVAAMFPLGASAGGMSGSASLSSGLEASGSPGSDPSKPSAGATVHGSSDMASSNFQSGTEIQGSARGKSGFFRPRDRSPQELSANTPLSANAVIVPGSNQPDNKD